MEAEVNGIKFTDADVVNKDNFIPLGEYNPHNVHPFLLHDHGTVICVVFASSLQDALDEAVDENKLDRFQLDPTKPEVQADYMHEVEADDGYKVTRPDGSVVWLDWNDGVALLGNASEPFDIEDVDAVEMANPPYSFAAMWEAANP